MVRPFEMSKCRTIGLTPSRSKPSKAQQQLHYASERDYYDDGFERREMHDRDHHGHHGHHGHNHHMNG